VPFPPLPEQAAIAGALSDSDALTESLTTLPSSLLGVGTPKIVLRTDCIPSLYVLKPSNGLTAIPLMERPCSLLVMELEQERCSTTSTANLTRTRGFTVFQTSTSA